MNQVPTYTDSKEKFDTLDLLDQFTNAMPPGEFSSPMYLRLSGFGMPPQGEDLFEAALGKKGLPFTATLAGDLAGTDTEIALASVNNPVPKVGVVLIGTEMIRYGDYDSASQTLLNCVRGYADTVADDYTGGEPMVMQSSVFWLNPMSPTVSVWVETDHLIQFMSGCVVNQLTVPIQNEDGVLLTFSGRGMRMGLAGKTTLAAAAAVGDSTARIADPKRFSVGARLYNKTKNDVGTDGYEVLSINRTTGDLTLDEGVLLAWEPEDEICGYLPPPVISGDAVEARTTTVMLGGVQGKVLTTELSIGIPKEFLGNEVGNEFPEEFAATARSITLNLDCVMRKAAVEKFYDAYNGQETDAVLTMGNVPGKRISFILPRIKPTMPTVVFSGPAVTLQIPAKAMGKVVGNQIGENSISIVLE
jgi:hypothetical protein